MTAERAVTPPRFELHVDELVLDVVHLAADRLGPAIDEAIGRLDWSVRAGAAVPSELALDELVVELPAGAGVAAVADAVAIALWRAATGSAS